MEKYICENCDSEVLQDHVYCKNCGAIFEVSDAQKSPVLSSADIATILKTSKKAQKLITSIVHHCKKVSDMEWYHKAIGLSNVMFLFIEDLEK